MRTVTVPALRTFTHQGQTYQRGDLVTLAALDAAILKRLGHVSLSSGQYFRSDLTAGAPASPDVEEQPSRRRRRRHANAEQDQPA